ncbi:MAG: glycosyltransferase [Chitinophagaceae bacterium]|nr:glycosyltransferase [Chitinophagaceae bacterium]MCW5928655.1 glycosyltransferase [Chitinophagaceae bacterium]
MEKHLHIVCLQVPYPPDYGGVIDLFQKLKYLKERGVSIYLHCFDDGRGEQSELNKYCRKVFYYQRKKGLLSFSFSIPYIVRSRRSRQLEKNLSPDNYPVLLEGIHCTYLLHTGKLRNRKVIIRLHNNESVYYKQLADNTHSLFRKCYFLYESLLLKKYEPAVIEKAGIGLSVSLRETLHFNKHLKNVHYLPVFVPWDDIQSLPGKGNYSLYHGNLSVEENEKAAGWLIEHIFCDLSIPFIIAGKDPSDRLRKLAAKYAHIRIIENPDMDTMHMLLQEAHINILPSFSETGIKFKLLHALFTGRFCITNTAMVNGTGMEPACIIADTAMLIREKIKEGMNSSFTTEDISARRKILLQVYDNAQNAGKLVSFIF